MTIAAEVKVTGSIEHANDNMQKMIAGRLAVVANKLRDNIVKSLKISNQRGLSPSEHPDPPRFGIGDLLKSIKAVQKDTNEWHVGSFGDVATPISGYAHQLEFGGFLENKRQKYMWIPSSDKAKHHKNQNRTPSEFPESLFIVHPKAAGGRYAVAASRSAGGELVVHYVLRKTAYQSAHPFIRPAAVDPSFVEQAKRIMSSTSAGDVSAEELA